MTSDEKEPTALTYGELRAALTRRAAFESYQEGLWKSPSYVLNVRPHSKSREAFTLTGLDLHQLLRDALVQLTRAQPAPVQHREQE